MKYTHICTKLETANNFCVFVTSIFEVYALRYRLETEGVSLIIDKLVTKTNISSTLSTHGQLFPAS